MDWISGAGALTWHLAGVNHFIQMDGLLIKEQANGKYP